MTPPHSRTVSEPIPLADDGCPFCKIAQSYSTFDPSQPPSAAPSPIPPTSTTSNAISGPEPETFMLLSTPIVMAFLDIAPLSRGHLLLCPRQHREKLTAVTPMEARELGYWTRVLSAALVKATGVEDWNVVQNNGAAAAQVVPHAHFHIIPRPELREQGRWRDHFTMFGRGTRTSLDDEDGVILAAAVRKAVKEVLVEEAKRSKL